MTQEVQAIVLNWNEPEQTIKCIASLKEQTYDNLHICLVDNNSTDESVDRIQQKFPDIDYRNASKNLGFAGGMNLGITESVNSGAEYTWILNNDIIIDEVDTLERLVSILSLYNADIVTPTILNQKGETWFEQGEISRWTGSSSHISGNQDSLDNEILINDYIPFCAALFDTSIFTKIGMLAEDYFMYYEDVDYCYRVSHTHNNLIVTATDVSVTHEVSSSSDGALGQLQTYYVYRNQLRFIKKFADDLHTLAPVLYLFSVMYGVSRRVFRLRPQSVISLLRGLVHGIQGKNGKGPYP
jgi:hypothetical protein